MIVPPSPLRLSLDSAALVANWRWLARQGGAAACGAAVKADGYGVGARTVVDLLGKAGCRDFFVASWVEAAALGDLADTMQLSVLHGVRADDMPTATQAKALPVLNTIEQVMRWKTTGLPCDVMIDTGMNRLGLSTKDVADGLLDGLHIETLMSHLACADENSSMNGRQLQQFKALDGKTSAARMSIANSAGILLGKEFALDMTRPGLALYGGVPRDEAIDNISQVAFPQAQIIQRRRVFAGETVGYGASFVAARDTEIAILNLGYADGYLRGFGDTGTAGGGRFPVLGRVSMDLLAVSVDAEPSLGEGDWLSIDFSLAEAARVSRLSQYELLTGLGNRYDRVWI